MSNARINILAQHVFCGYYIRKRISCEDMRKYYKNDLPHQLIVLVIKKSEFE